MKIISKIDCIKKQYQDNINYPTIDKKYSYKIVEDPDFYCKVFNNGEENTAVGIDCRDIDCENCFFCKGSVEDIKKYINLL